MSNSLLGFSRESLLSTAEFSSPKAASLVAQVFVGGRGDTIQGRDLGELSVDWQNRPELQTPLIQKYAERKGPLWVIKIDPPTSRDHHRQFEMSALAMVRDTVGAVYRELGPYETVHLKYFGKDPKELEGALLGFELAQYRFKNFWPVRQMKKQKLYIEAPKVKNAKAVLQSAKVLGEAVNVSRHLVNLPPNLLNPTSYAQFVKELFKPLKVKLEVWDSARLEKENMGLHQAVGQASETPPCLVKISYAGGNAKKRGVFVGKGITFDSGGLDIKPASGMREMKKDMGGSASVVGLAYWMAKSGLKMTCDFYLALAENAVGSNAFRPGDILRARNGKTVEIHNTDAEGRLVLSDALALAAEAKPEWMIDLATLTGAIKVALGETTPGLFCNNDALATKLLKAAQVTGDNCWRMPLDPSQKSKLRSDVADLVNAHEGFGGAVTAALFLEAFVAGIPWAHFDIYAWNSSPSGALSEKGGSGQLVQALAEYCRQLK